MMLRLRKAVSNRVTVSRDEPIIWAMSSWVNTFSIRVDSLLHSSNKFANRALAVCSKSKDRVRSVS
jgi:hypothetical protein